MKETTTHIYFLKNYLSNFHISYFIEPDSKIEFKTTEQYFMYQKALFFKDFEIAQKILKSTSPLEAKQLGRSVKNYDSSWEDIRFKVMLYANYLKYTQNDVLKNKLISTGNKILVEASPTDLIWCVGLTEDDPLILDSSNYKGQNLLGICLMHVRDIINKDGILLKCF